MLTPREAAKHTGIDYRTLVDGAKRGVLRCQSRPTGRGGEQPMFERSELLEDLASCTCSYPECLEPAPGASGRCARHRTKVTKPTVQLTCEHCGKTFTRAGSWLAENPDQRGHYCSN